MNKYSFKDILGTQWIVPGYDEGDARTALRDCIRGIHPLTDPMITFIDNCELVGVSK